MSISIGASATDSANSTTFVTLVIPASVLPEHWLVAVFVNRDATASPTVVDTDTGGAPWSLLAAQNAATNGAISAWYKKASHTTAGKTISATGFTGSCAGGVTAFSGASPEANPFLGTTIVGESNASGNETQAEIVVVEDGSMVLLVVGCTSNDTLAVASQAATDPSSLAEQFEDVSSGGGDCSIALACALKAAAGGTGAFTWGQTDGTGASLAFALRPFVAPNFENYKFARCASAGVISLGDRIR
jgi:hypothetical protein